MPLLGERLRAERERLDLSQQELAERCGVTMRSQRNYEKGERQPDAAYLAAFTALGGDVLYVLTGVQSNPPTSAGLTGRRENVYELTGKSNAPATAHLAAESQGAYKLNQREQALIENYRGSDDQGRRALEGAASAVAHRDSAKKD